MKRVARVGSLKPRLRNSLFLAIFSATFALLATLAFAEGEGEKAAKTEEAVPQGSESGAAKAKPRAAQKKLSGAELYSMHCNRCHPERYPTERTAAQWKTIMLHMRVRANLPGEQARELLKYLQENSGR
jgi:hypothetical protein